MTFRRPDRPEAAFALALLLVLPVMLVKLIEPLHSDNALYQSMAIDLFRYGKLPYLGSWDHNTPGILLFHLVPLAIFGNSEVAFRSFDMVLQMLFAAWLFRTGEKLWDERAGFASTLLFGLYVLHAGQPISGQRDLYAIELLLVAGYMLYSTRSLNTSIISGVLLGIVLLVKPTLAAHAALMLLMVRDLRKCSWAVVAAIATLALSLLPFALTTGALQEYYYSVVRFNADVYSKFGNDIAAFWYEVKREWYLIALAAIGAYFAFAKNKLLTALYIIGIVGALMLAFMQGKYMRYHFAPFYMMLLPLGGLAVARLSGRVPRGRTMPTLAYVLVLGFFAYKTQPLRAFASGGIAAAKAATVDEGPYLYSDEQQVLDYLRPIAETGTVEVIALNARMRALIGARSATHFTLVHSLGLLAGGTFEAPQYTDFQQRWRRTFLGELAQHMPDRIVIAHATHSWYLRDPGHVVTRIAGYNEFIASRYEPDTTIGVFEILKRRDAR